MKNERIYEAIASADDELLCRCEAAGNRPKYWRRWGALAACLCVIVIGAAIVSRLHTGDHLPETLPILTISENSGAMGMEGYLAYDISELVNENPWTSDADILALPVYKNTLVYDGNNAVPGADYDKMKQFLLEIAERLGFDIDSLEITDEMPSKSKLDRIIEKYESAGEEVPEGCYAPDAVTAKQGGVIITVSNQMIATIETTVLLPKVYNFADYASYEDILAVAEYLGEQYSTLIGMENPKADISGGYYDIYARQLYHISFFEAGGGIEEQIVNYFFHRIDFYSGDSNVLHLIRSYQEDLSEKVGDYPIISAQEARALLDEGYYITTVPYTMGEVLSVELVYRTGGSDEYYMPYYRFLIELPEAELENGLKSYGAYYVPAVQRQYISDLTVWDGKFNS